jgi:hypothetical protein
MRRVACYRPWSCCLVAVILSVVAGLFTVIHKWEKIKEDGTKISVLWDIIKYFFGK